ncbi:unnamed protein product [Cylicostephanus goldi]|uniref:Uncharacterized protein n=1 Tax=Cylicostephanus goldi TaxID=71465 RepID=A0A3P7N8G2_CYLGO|nr:unnamed protein product [Cylicostephanus goldi]
MGNVCDCLTTRAVHLEVVENLTTGVFLDSFTDSSRARMLPSSCAVTAERISRTEPE